MTPTRKYLREGPFFKISSQQKVLDRYAFLFNDLLVWVGKKRLGSKSYQVHQIIYLNRSILNDIAEVPEEEEKNSFEIIHSGDGRYVAAFTDATQKKEWFDLLKELTSAFASEQAEEYKNELRFVDEENDDEVPAALLKHSHTAAPVMVLPPLTSMPKLTSKESRHQSNTVNSVSFPAASDPPAVDKAELASFTLPRNRKGSAPGALKPRPFAKPDQNILQAVSIAAGDSAASVGSGDDLATTESAPALPKANPGASEESRTVQVGEDGEPLTSLRRQRSLSLNHIDAPGVNKVKPTRGDPHRREQGDDNAAPGPTPPPVAARNFSVAPVFRKPGVLPKPPSMTVLPPTAQAPTPPPTQAPPPAAAPPPAVIGSPPPPPPKTLKPKPSMPPKAEE